MKSVCFTGHWNIGYCRTRTLFSRPPQNRFMTKVSLSPSLVSRSSRMTFKMLVLSSAIFNGSLSKVFGRSMSTSCHHGESHDPQVFAPAWLKFTKTPGDGSCLFHALSTSLMGKIGSAQDIRIRVIEAIPRLASSKQFNGATLEQWIEWETGMSPSEYIKIMSKHSSWGGQASLPLPRLRCRFPQQCC